MIVVIVIAIAGGKVYPHRDPPCAVCEVTSTEEAALNTTITVQLRPVRLLRVWISEVLTQANS